MTRRLPEPVEIELSARFSADLNPDDVPLTPQRLRSALMEADGLLCTVTDDLDADVFAVHPVRARILANFGVGHEHIDLEAAHSVGLTVTNTPGVLTESTADLTMSLLLAVTRRTGEGERLLRRGEWSGWGPTSLLGRELRSLTLGIIGMGRIGRAVARRATRGFGMRVRYWTPRPLPPDGLADSGAEACGTLDELLQASDVVSLHCPSTPATHHLMNRERLRRMRPGSFLLNTARGNVVDEAALVEVLAEGRLAGAGLDVYEREPAVSEALVGMEQVVLLPHLGSATRETREAMGRRALANLIAFFDGRPVPDLVA